MSRMQGAITQFDSAKLRGAIDEHVKEAGWSRAAFAKSCGIDPSSISKMLKRGSCNVEMLYRIADTLCVNRCEFVDKVGLFPNKPFRYRALKNLSRRELAEKAGVSETTIESLETGRDCMTIPAACIARTLGVPLGVYLGYEG